MNRIRFDASIMPLAYAACFIIGKMLFVCYDEYIMKSEELIETLKRKVIAFLKTTLGISLVAVLLFGLTFVSAFFQCFSDLTR